MGRLIDADKLIEFIDCGHLRHPGELWFSEIDVVNMLNHAPTAYDVDAVISELGKASGVAQPVGWSAKKEIVELKTAIQLVKGGGVE